MFYALVIVAAVLFIAHVGLLIASFGKSGFVSSRYFYSHLTLWFTGLTVFTLAIFFAGHNQSAFLDYFNTPLKQGMILAGTFALSLVAHGIVKLVVLPLVTQKK